MIDNERTRFEYGVEPEGFPMLDLPPTARRCPSCTFGNTKGGFRTYGCVHCAGLGRLTWRFSATPVGGHVRVRVWQGMPGAGAGVGELVMTGEDWDEWKELVADVASIQIIERVTQD